MLSFPFPLPDLGFPSQGKGFRQLSVYEVLPGAGTKERAMRGYSAADSGATERLHEKVVEVAKKAPCFDWSALLSDSKPHPRHQPTWPQICQAEVACQLGQRG